MPNMKNIFSQHNKSIESKKEPVQNERNCNCRNSGDCPVGNQCLTNSLIYPAVVTRLDNGKEETYIGLTANTFKTRFTNHTSSFRHRHQSADTNLAKYVWSLKDKNIPHNIKWKIVAKSKAYSPTSKACNQCIKEKYYIICRPEMASLNNRNELATECRHRKRHLLSNLKE